MNFTEGSKDGNHLRQSVFWDGQGLWNPASGVYSHALRLAKGLIGLGVDPIVLLPEPKIGILGNEIRQLPVRSVLPEKILKLKPVFSELAWQTAKKLDQNPPGIYHGLSNFNLPAIVLGRFRQQTKFVLTVHDIIPLLANTHSALALQMRILLPKALKTAHKVICSSNWTMRTLEERYGSLCHGKMVVIPLGVSPERFPLKTSMGQRSPWKTGKRLLAVSRGESYKRLELAVEVCSLLRDASMVVVTDQVGRRNLQNRFGSYALNQSGITIRVGDVSDSELESFYSEADIFLQTSLYEGFGLPAVEAMQRGCPVAYTGGSGIDEVCGSDGPLRFEPVDHAANWASSLENLWAAGSPRDTLREAILKRLTAFLSWEEVSARHLEIYRGLI